jgi:hypothetical protein
MAKRYAVVLSDIHIGDNSPTCWYQKSVHEHVNSGFECVPVPDKNDRFTLTIVDLETAVGKLFTVTGSGVVPTRVGPMDSAIRSPFRDYSCYVGITNGPRPLQLVKSSKDSDS